MKRTFLLLVCILCALIPMSAQKVISAKVAGVIYEALSDSTARLLAGNINLPAFQFLLL